MKTELIEKLDQLEANYYSDYALQLNGYKEAISDIKEAIAELEKPSVSAEEVYNEMQKKCPINLGICKKYIIQAMHDYAGKSDAKQLYEALEVCRASLATYGSHPIIDMQVQKAMKSYQAFLNREEGEK